MKCFLSSMLLLGLTFCSCNKKEDPEKVFYGNLPIVSTNVPDTVLIGQDIISQVRCELPSSSGTVIFQGFDIKEVATRQFNIKAKALYKDWSTEIDTAVIWSLDTIMKIKTTDTGQHILNFYNSARLVKADTVQVN